MDRIDSFADIAKLNLFVLYKQQTESNEKWEEPSRLSQDKLKWLMLIYTVALVFSIK